VVITGFSGAGKSQAMACFEDGGYFCVDNLPPEMIGSLAELFDHEGSKVERAAVVCDVRGGAYFDGLLRVLDARGPSTRLLFLEAAEDVLLDRYKETRRRHPLADHVAAGIDAERDLLAPLKARADVSIDTSDFTAARLRKVVADKMLPRGKVGRLAVTFLTSASSTVRRARRICCSTCGFCPTPITRTTCGRSRAWTRRSGTT